MTPAQPDYELTLFVSGASEISARAIANARSLCDTYLDGRGSLSVVDVCEDPTLVLPHGVFAVPTLVRDQPLPVRRFVGDLVHIDRVLHALELGDDAPATTS
ncbi:MAG: circadian clock protein KaiB [Solirubrobacteraceae bacterium]|jgi:circadian clock protein KaiB|nr:circadian clock protein KaiB [Solirubrobacteraceae bacterium]MEA2610378.1 circadian clock protein KaiB [Chloroflexota bacterium]